ncbi:MAG: isocitrate lyase/phosphoenolpyruvate mutase family protein [Burkholderiaceae bacterium]
MSPTPPSLTEKRRTFRELHESGCFVIPNPWDKGSARYLQGLGFKALASTSSGLAWSLGRSDNDLPRDAVLAHLSELVAATDVPINADFENGFAHEPAAVAHNVRLAVDTGVAGLSIEDSTGDPSRPLYDLELATERIRAARRAIDQSGADVLLVGRAECFLVGRADLEETIGRLQAYAQAGADCLYAPGVRDRAQIATLVQRLAPKPVNLLAGPTTTLSISEIAELGVRRVSVGGALARAAWTGFMTAAQALAKEGRFSGFGQIVAGDQLDTFFATDSQDPS